MWNFAGGQHRSRSRDYDTGYGIDPTQAIVDGSDARHIRGSDPQGRAFPLVGNHALEDDNPVGNDHIDALARSPWLSVDFIENLFSDFRVGPGTDRLFGEQPDNRGHDIGSAHDTDESSLIDHGQPLHMLGLHQPDKIADGRLWCDADYAIRHHVADFAPMRMHVFLRQPSRPDEEGGP